MSDLSERDFQSNVIELAMILGWRVAHFRAAHPRGGQWVTPMTGHVGFPDLVLAREGRVVFAELKSEKGTLSEEQGKWLAELAGPDGSGAETYLWRPSNIDKVQEVLSGRR